MAKGRKVPQAPVKPACDCEDCQRTNRVLQRERQQIEAYVIENTRIQGRGAVIVHLCKDCGDHIADDRPDAGLEYVPQRDTRQWNADDRASIATYQVNSEYVAVVFDHWKNAASSWKLSYAPTTPSA